MHPSIDGCVFSLLTIENQNFNIKTIGKKDWIFYIDSIII